jgi:hypothetical protein
MNTRKAIFSNEVLGPLIDSPADKIVDDAWDEQTPAKRVKLARKALSIDLDALDAYNILGIHAETLAERIALFREAVLIGERLLAPAFAEEDMHWWGFVGTRPWMRAQHNLGLALLEAGDRAAATAVFKRLLALNSNDNQGIRTLLLKIMAEEKDYSGCKILFADYPEEASIEFVATRLLVDIATKRKMDFPQQFAALNEVNAHALPLLIKAAREGKWPAAPTAELIAWGSKQEAALYLAEFRQAWTVSSKLLAGFLEAYEKYKTALPGQN